MLIRSNEGILGNFGKLGALSSEFERDALEAKCLLNISLFSLESFMVWPFSNKGGILEYFLFSLGLVILKISF